MHKSFKKIDDISFISKTNNSKKRDFWKPIQSKDSSYGTTTGVEMAYEYLNYLSNADIAAPILASIILDATKSKKPLEDSQTQLIEFISTIEITLKRYIREK